VITSTTPETHKAAKVYLCDSCGERVQVGEQYVRWRCFDDGDAGTVRMHPECHQMHLEGLRAGEAFEFTLYSYDRPTQEPAK
jgi:predicted RNA-binding Zn-ribbon protein involved in translation (DUF1610 family)